MTADEKLITIINRVKCGFYLTINAHRDYYETVEKYFQSNPINQGKQEEIDKDVFQRMKETNTIVEIQFYPDTPIGFYTVYHYDVERALEEAMDLIEEILPE